MQPQLRLDDMPDCGCCTPQLVTRAAALAACTDSPNTHLRVAPNVQTTYVPLAEAPVGEVGNRGIVVACVEEVQVMQGACDA